MSEQTTMSFANLDDLVAGVDEAGRGPLAGAVVAAAVILPRELSNKENLLFRNDEFALLTDSKKMTATQREKLFPLIQEKAIAWGIAWASNKEIDAINILQASLLAMSRSLKRLEVRPKTILIDGNKIPNVHDDLKQCHIEAVVKGDSKIPAISAASVLAKVTRDRQLHALHEKYPIYNFKQHKGYPTKAHLAMLEEHGPCPEHRFSFGPVKLYSSS